MVRIRSAIFAILSAFAFTQIAACASEPQTRSTGRFIDDAAITAKVKTALAQEPEVSAMDINVTTYRGVVQLSGVVPSETAARAAVETAKEVEGVRSIDNKIDIKQARR